METERKSPKIRPVKVKKKRSALAKAAIVLGALVLVFLIAAGVLGMNLLSKLYRPDTPTVFAEDDETEELPEVVPSPGGSNPAPTGTPEVTPEPTPTPEVVLPLSDVYPQTALSPEYLLQMDTEANDARYTHVLLIGVDRRGKAGNSRADTLMIATIDRVNKRLKLTSLLRDTLVNIPGVGYGKLNSSASKGGVALLLETVNESFHLNLANYVLVDFTMFERIIDELDGITVAMTAAEISAANDCIAGLNRERGESYLWDGFIFANAGNVKLTGKQALGYARVRHLDSDFNRTNRQFSVLTAAFAKFMKANLSKQYKMLNSVLPLVETNMTDTAIIDAMLSVLSLDTKGLLHGRMPVDGLYKSGSYARSSVLLSDIPANAQALHAFIFQAADDPKEAKVLKPGESLPPRTPTPTDFFPPYIDEGSGGIIVYPDPEPPVTDPAPEPTPPVEGEVP